MSARGLAAPKILMPTDLARVPDPCAAAALLPPGAAVILRDREDPRREQMALRLRAVTRDLGLWLLVANDPGLARQVDADGLHLAERDVGLFRPWRFTLAAAHSLQAIRRAERAGVDGVLISPVFPTRSHPGGQVLGLQRARVLARHTGLISYAMGGMNQANARQLGPAFHGFAAISAFS